MHDAVHSHSWSGRHMPLVRHRRTHNCTPARNARTPVSHRKQARVSSDLVACPSHRGYYGHVLPDSKKTSVQRHAAMGNDRGDVGHPPCERVRAAQDRLATLFYGLYDALLLLSTGRSLWNFAPWQL